MAVGGAELVRERARLRAEIVEHAAAVAQLPYVAGHLIGRALDEELATHAAGPVMPGDADAAAIPRIAGSDEHQRGETRLGADVRRRLLIQRDRVADLVESNALARGAGHESDVGVMAVRIAAM